MAPRSLSCLSLAAVLIASFAAPLAAAPSIANISPRGLRIGQTTTISITGTDLTPDARLLMPATIASQTIKGEAKGDRMEIEVTLDAATPPGLYPVRLAGSKGISNPVVLGVDRLPQVSFV